MARGAGTAAGPGRRPLTTLRLIAYEEGTGPENMALDEAILEAVAAGQGPPTLRFYGWQGRWLSIGMAEPIADVDRAAAKECDVAVVRRPSGGTAVLHDDQIAWSLALPSDHPLAPGDIVESYRLQSAITLAAMRRLGIEARAASIAEARAPLPDALLALACFGGLAPHEIVFGDPLRKLVGWGQVRRRGVVMHHAVVSLRFDAEALAGLLAVDRPRLRGALEQRVVGLCNAAGRAIEAGEVVEAVGAAFREPGYALGPGELADEELERARGLVRDKYAAESWTARR